MSMKLLVPLDGSPQSESVIPFLRLLADRTAVEIELMRCYESLSTIYAIPPDLFSLEMENLFNDTIPASLTDYLEALRGQLDGIPSVASVQCGPPAAEILAQSEAANVDLIVMASHGRRGLDRWLLGSVTTKVVRAAKKPVLVVAGPDLREPRLDSLLVAIDGSPCSLRAFEQAKGLALRIGAELVLYRAVGMSWTGADRDPELAQAEEELQALAATCVGLETRVRVYPTDGPPYIVERAEELKADLVVLGSHGRRGLEHLLMGSVAEHTLHHARCPVMIVH